MNLSNDSGSTKWNMITRNGSASDSDGSSLVSCGSAAVSFIDSQYSGRESQISDTDRRILDAGPAPPDYAQATADRRLLSSRLVDEESLYSASEVDVTFHVALRTTKRKGLRRFLKQHWRRICLVNLAVYCLLTTILLIVAIVFSQNDVFHQSEVVHVFDVFPPDHPESYVHLPWDENGEYDFALDNRYNQERFHQNTSQCLFTSFPDDFYYFGYIDPDNFHFSEELNSSDYLDYYQMLGDDVSISGNIEVRPAYYSQNEPIEVILSYAWTSAWQAGPPDWDFSSDTGSLRLHRSQDRDMLVSQNKQQGLGGGQPERGKACLSIWVGIYVGTQLDNFSITTENLHVDIGPSTSYKSWTFSFRIRDESIVHTNKGNITTSDWDARNAKFTSESGSIRGKFGLNNNLHIETKGGSEILAQVWQEAAHEQKYLSSHPPGTPANLTTITGPGKQSIELFQALNPIVWAEKLGYGYPFLIDSSHRSDVGNISVLAGMYWGGEMHATTGANHSIEFSGNGVRSIPSPVDEIAHGDEFRDAWARKGPWDSLMRIETQEGNISVCAEEDWECEHFLPDLNRFLYPDWPALW